MTRVASLLVGAVLLLAPSIAAAHDEPGPQKAEAKEGEKVEAEKEAEPPWEVAIDFAGGATTTDILTAGPATRVARLPPANVFDSTRVSAYTFLFGVERHLGDRLTVGVRMPLIVADLSSRTGAADNRSVSLIGNVEIEGAYVLARGANWDLVGTLELALPTAGGKEPPTAAEVAAEPEKRFDYRRYDTFAAAHAGAAVRGSYESALFESGNLGIVPKLAANIRLSKLTVTPMVKLENLFDVTGDAEEVYINELVGGVRAGYRASAAVEPGVHLWVRELHEHTHSDDSYSAVAVVEPYVRFHLGALKPAVSVILPFTGDLADNKTYGVRGGVVGEF